MTSLALIGPGRHGTAIARIFASHGIDVVLYHHRKAKAEAAAAAIRAVARDADVTIASSAPSGYRTRQGVLESRDRVH